MKRTFPWKMLVLHISPLLFLSRTQAAGVCVCTSSCQLSDQWFFPHLAATFTSSSLTTFINSHKSDTWTGRIGVQSSDWEHPSNYPVPTIQLTKWLVRQSCFHKSSLSLLLSLSLHVLVVLSICVAIKNVHLKRFFCPYLISAHHLNSSSLSPRSAHLFICGIPTRLMFLTEHLGKTNRGLKESRIGKRLHLIAASVSLSVYLSF